MKLEGIYVCVVIEILIKFSIVVDFEVIWLMCNEIADSSISPLIYHLIVSVHNKENAISLFDPVCNKVTRGLF